MNIMDNKTAMFVNYKKQIIRAIDLSMDYLKSNPNQFSCSILGFFVGAQTCNVIEDDVLREYRKVCRARHYHSGFRGYTNEQWSNKSQEDQQKIRIKKLEKFKKHFVDNY